MTTLSLQLRFMLLRLRTLSMPSASSITASQINAERVDTNESEIYFSDQLQLDFINIGGHTLRSHCPKCSFPLLSCHCPYKICGEWISKCESEY